ncbi:FHA domain-containing protein [Streptomyces sp. enrichment culture]|uniref:FHA domain-containing protein n=1 Tax=Streptomyces sp. enrichment culture TaxID=1795815 RepID=UPI003F57FF37
MPTCPNGHQSGSDDWCEVCGHRMAGAVPPPPPPPPAGGYGFPPPAPGGPGAGAGPELCPQCRTPREGGAPFCEECRWNFLTNTATSYTPAAPRPSSGPPPHFQQQPGPPPPPPSYGGDSYPGARPPEYQGSRPSQINRPAEPIPQSPPGFGSDPSRPVPPPPGPPPGAPGGPGGPGGASGSGGPEAPGGPRGTNGFGGPGGPNGPGGPGPQGPGAQGRPGAGPHGTAPGATAPGGPPAPWQQQAGPSAPPPPPPAPAFPQESNRQQPSGPPQQGGPSFGGGDDDWRIAPPGGGQNGPGTQGGPGGPGGQGAPAGPGGQSGYGYPQPGGHQAPPPPPPGYGYPQQPQQPQAPQPPQPQAPWTATIGPDRDYFMAMMQRSGPEAAGLNLPAYSPEQQRPLTGNQLTIGRRRHSTGDTPDIDLSVPPEDPGVSHQHAILVQQPDGGWAVVDQNSTNGTTVNGGEEPIQPYVPVPLQDGDRVHVGAWTTITIRRG